MAQQLQSMGFSYSGAISALAASSGNFEAAMDMLLNNEIVDDEPESAPKPEIERMVEQQAGVWLETWDDLLVELKEMGFDNDVANRSLIAEKGGNLKDAVKELITKERSTNNANSPA